MHKIKFVIFLFLLFIFCAIILTLTLRGISANPTSEILNQDSWKDDGPFELSPERGRFALTYSIIEDKSFSFSIPLASFVIPDLGFINGKYVSLFAPGVSYLVIPGYWLGKYLGISQVGTYALISLFALTNVLLIRAIAIRLGASQLASTIASIIFIFATPAFAYAVSLYQHHISTFLILFSIYILVRFKGIWTLFLIWFLCAASIPIDYPNLFLMLPIGLFALGRFIYLVSDETKIKINIKMLGFLTFATALIPLIFFLWFNKVSYQNPLQFSGTVSSVSGIDAEGKPTAPLKVNNNQEASRLYIEPEKQQKSAIGFFKTRNLLNGFYIHLLSPDRGIIFYTPVVLFGIAGLYLLTNRNQKVLSLFLGIIAINLILYSMWGDPYGGYAFGSRYLIPAYAILSITTAIVLTQWRKNTKFIIIFLIILSYSLAINTIGAITTNRNPPKIEAIPLEKLSGVEEKYTFQRNFEYLAKKGSKSFIFNTYVNKYMSPWQYYLYISFLLISSSTLMVIYLRFFEKEN